MPSSLNPEPYSLELERRQCQKRKQEGDPMPLLQLCMPLAGFHATAVGATMAKHQPPLLCQKA